MPATYYAKHDKTLDGMHLAMAQDLTELFESGLKVSVPFLIGTMSVWHQYKYRILYLQLGWLSMSIQAPG